MVNLLQRFRTGKTKVVQTNDYSEVGIGRLFVQSPTIDGSHIGTVETPYGTVLISHRQDSLFMYLGGKGFKPFPNYTLAPGYLVRELDPMQHTKDKVLSNGSVMPGSTLRTFEVSPIPEAQRREVSDAIHKAGFQGDVTYDVSWEQRIGRNECPVPDRLNRVRELLHIDKGEAHGDVMDRGFGVDIDSNQAYNPLYRASV